MINVNNSNINWFIERAYNYQPIKMVEFQHPCPRYVVYMYLKRDVCASLFPSGKVYSEAFYLDGQGLFLKGQCNNNCFRYLCMLENGSSSFEYEFAVRSKKANEFVRKLKGIYTFTTGWAFGLSSLLAVPWT